MTDVEPLRAETLLRIGEGEFVLLGIPDVNGSIRGKALRPTAFEAAELAPGIIVHSTLELVRYLCPACGRQHSVEVRERGMPPLPDLRVRRA